jgi:hypothetical protein
MYQPTARSGPACLASLFVCSPVPITRPYHEKPSFDGYRSGLFESGRPPEPCCGVPEWTRRCAPRPRRCGIRGPAHSWSLSPRSARPRSASSPPWSSATSLISRPVRPCLGHPHPAHRPGHRHRAALPAQRSQEGPRRAGSAGGARVKGSSNGSSNGEASHGGAATPPLATGPGGSTALAVLPLPKDRAGWRERATASPDPAFGDCVHARRPHVARTVLIPASARTASKMSVRFDPRSRIMNFVRSACPPRSISRLRACWGAVHSPVGCRVTPRMRMRRVACSITARTWA